MIKFVEKVVLGRTCANTLKAIHGKHLPNIILNGETIKSIPFQSGRNDVFPLSLFISNMTLEMIKQ